MKKKYNITKHKNPQEYIELYCPLLQPDTRVYRHAAPADKLWKLVWKRTYVNT